MVRLRLATLAVAAGVGLVCGCLSMSQIPLLDRLRSHHAAECCDTGAIPDGAVPIAEGPAINGVPPSGAGVTPIPSVPPNGIPPLASPQRIAPQPQAQPIPYTP